LAILPCREAVWTSVPQELVSSTVRAASQSALGNPVTAGVVSAEGVNLTREGLKAMLLSKLKINGATVLAVFTLTTGGVSLTYRARANEAVIPAQDFQKRAEASKPSESFRKTAIRDDESGSAAIPKVQSKAAQNRFGFGEGSVRQDV